MVKGREERSLTYTQIHTYVCVCVDCLLFVTRMVEHPCRIKWVHIRRERETTYMAEHSSMTLTEAGVSEVQLTYILIRLLEQFLFLVVNLI